MCVCVFDSGMTLNEAVEQVRLRNVDHSDAVAAVPPADQHHQPQSPVQQQQSVGVVADSLLELAVQTGDTADVDEVAGHADVGDHTYMGNRAADMGDDADVADDDADVADDDMSDDGDRATTLDTCADTIDSCHKADPGSSQRATDKAGSRRATGKADSGRSRLAVDR